MSRAYVLGALGLLDLADHTYHNIVTFPIVSTYYTCVADKETLAETSTLLPNFAKDVLQVRPV